jgi:ComF family protein
MPLLRTMLAALADLAYPTTCIHCQTFCDGPGPLCPTCDGQLSNLILAPACAHCALPLAQANAPCPRCLGKGIRPYGNIARLCVYTAPMNTLIRQLKYHRRWPLADWLTDRLLEQPRTNEMLKKIDCIIPVPLHPRRRRSRGYNQAQLIAHRLAKKSGKSLINPVARIRDTEQQTRMTATDRQSNVRGAFALRKPRLIEGKHVLIVDDVMTTGATLQSVARTLLPAKPASLHAVVLAVADPTHRDFLHI